MQYDLEVITNYVYSKGGEGIHVIHISAHRSKEILEVLINFNREFVADSVIQATGTVEFEDGLRMGVLFGGCWGP